MTRPLKLLEQTFFVAVDAAHPGKHLAGYLPDLPKGRLVVVGAGKAAARMAAAAEARYGPELQRLEGLVVTRHGHAVPTQKIAVVEAAHPVPDAAGRRRPSEFWSWLEAWARTTCCSALFQGAARRCSPRPPA